MKTKFEVKYAPRFLKSVKALDREAQVQVLREINVLKTNPFAGKMLRGEWRGICSLRVDDYRILYKVEGNIILLLTVGHRKHIYR